MLEENILQDIVESKRKSLNTNAMAVNRPKFGDFHSDHFLETNPNRKGI